jgi:hypothetical protein
MEIFSTLSENQPILPKKGRISRRLFVKGKGRRVHPKET